jgi:GNAT superfamily N-acetyltransferase
MFETRAATAADAEQIAVHRRSMFVEMGQADDDRIQAMVEAFIPWVRERLADGRYLGWLVSDGEDVVAGGGMLLMDFAPHWRDPQPLRAYLLNFYVSPEARGKGIAYGLLKTAVAEARLRQIKVVTLHASRFGRPLYERNGFEASNEMMLMM